MARTAAVVGLLILLAGCADDAASPTTSRSITTCADRRDQVDVPYVADGDPLQRLDLYRPDDAGCDPVPVVVWVHGGGWRSGDKANGMDDKVRLWNGAGLAVASVNYRLTDQTSRAAQRVVAPTHNEDVATALAWLHTHSGELGIDPERVALLGHSAGAAIVAAVAADPGYLAAHGLDPTDIRCVAPLDTEGFDIERNIEHGDASARLYRSVFGDDPARWAALSPRTHLGEAPLPDLFLVTRGSSERQAQTTDFAAAAEAAGAEVTVVDLPGFSHADVNQRIGDPADQLLTPALQAFLSRCLEPG